MPLKTHKVPSHLSKNAILKLLHQVLPDSPHPSSLPEDVHGNREGHENQLNDTKPNEHGLGARVLEPVREEQTEHQTVKDILAEVEGNKSLASILTIAVDAESNGRC